MTSIQEKPDAVNDSAINIKPVLRRLWDKAYEKGYKDGTKDGFKVGYESGALHVVLGELAIRRHVPEEETQP